MPEREKRRRLVRLRETQRLASERARARRVGRVETVLVEATRALRRDDPLREALGSGTATVGRSQGEAPGVDGAIYFASDAAPGTFLNVAIRGATAFDFFGEVVGVTSAVPA